MATRFAECNTDYLFKTLNRLGSHSKTFNFEYGSPADVSNDQGIYMFYLDLGTRLFPVYIGVTTQGFKTRFSQHKSSGVKKKVDDDLFPSFTNGEKYTKRILKAKMVAMASGYMMKLVESLFLLSFNFCLNKAENRAYRQNLSAPAQLTDQESYIEWVEKHVAEMMTKTCPVATAMAPSTPEKNSRIKRSKIIDFQLYDINLFAYFYCTLKIVIITEGVYMCGDDICMILPQKINDTIVSGK